MKIFETVQGGDEGVEPPKLEGATGYAVTVDRLPDGRRRLRAALFDEYGVTASVIGGDMPPKMPAAVRDGIVVGVTGVLEGLGLVPQEPGHPVR